MAIAVCTSELLQPCCRCLWQGSVALRLRGDGIRQDDNIWRSVFVQCFLARACTNPVIGYVHPMPLTNLTVAEEALSLSPADRAELAKLLIQSLEGDARTDDAIKADLTNRLEQLRSGADPGLTFEEVFNSPL